MKIFFNNTTFLLPKMFNLFFFERKEFVDFFLNDQIKLIIKYCEPYL